MGIGAKYFYTTSAQLLHILFLSTFSKEIKLFSPFQKPCSKLCVFLYYGIQVNGTTFFFICGFIRRLVGPRYFENPSHSSFGGTPSGYVMYLISETFSEKPDYIILQIMFIYSPQSIFLWHQDGNLSNPLPGAYK